MDDWQETAITSRHFHNRTAKNSGGRTGRAAAFDIRKAFGGFELTCPYRAKSAEGSTKEKNDPWRRPGGLEVYRLSEHGRGVIGQMFLGTIEATVILGGSRRSLKHVITGLTKGGARPSTSEGRRGANRKGRHEENEEEEDSSVASDNEDDEDDEEAGEEGGPSTEARQRRRFQTFEKNSFRSPKFWFQWRGRAMDGQLISPQQTDVDGVLAGTGYIIFSGNDCRKFQGTISSEALGWDNISIFGWKKVSRSERDVPVSWAS